MTVGELGIGVNFVGIALIVTLVALLAAAFVIGRLDRQKRHGAEERLTQALRLERAREEVQIDNLRKEKEGILKAALRAEDAQERWETVKRDHEQLEAMRRELDDFEREESKRIDELERHRVEAARRLGDVQAALDQYPPEIVGNESIWDEVIARRKEDFDRLREHIDAAEKEYEEADARRTRAASETEYLEGKKSRLDGEIEEARGLLDQITQGQIDGLKPLNERLVEEAKRLQNEIEGLQEKWNTMQKDLKNATGSQVGRVIEKLAAFRSTPDCLLGFEEARPETETDEDMLLSTFEDALRDRGLQYSKRIIRAFHTALKVNDLSPLTVLSGLSGTGKSQLPRAYARFFGIHFLHVPVEPGWDSPQDLLGFYDFVAERYRPTDRARALGHFDSRFAKEIGIAEGRNWNERMLIILLDEMNLARTEYYFSEFLSRLEMRGPRGGEQAEGSLGDAQIAIDLPYAENEPPKHLYVPHNILWVGTLNEDETTQALSDKVLDRANSIRFAPPEPNTLRSHSKAPESGIAPASGYLPYQRWLTWSNRGTTVEMGAGEQVDKTLETLARCMQEAKRGFGYRIVQSIRAYIEHYPGQDWRQPMVDQINMRLLPKLSGAEMSECHDSLEELKRTCEEELGDDDFAEALQRAVTESQFSQIFTWPGYSYKQE